MKHTAQQHPPKGPVNLSCRQRVGVGKYPCLSATFYYTDSGLVKCSHCGHACTPAELREAQRRPM